MTRRLMLDSGAFGVWSQGARLDLKEYVAFCHAHPDTSYFIALDVIPGTKADPSPDPAKVEVACKEGFDNYVQMCKEVPAHKVIPVFHHPDPIKWLDKYLSRGAQYVALGGISKAGEQSRLSFLRRAKPLLFDGAGRPNVKIHGLGMTSLALMNYWEWHSVDSATWKKFASYGWFFLPKMRRGEYDYTLQPHCMGVSAISAFIGKRHRHVFTLPPHMKGQVMEYIESAGFTLGEWKVEKVDADYSIPRGSEEFWYDKSKRMLLRTVVKGVATSFEERARLNHEFMRRANKALPVKYIYYAGAPMPYPLEVKMGSRLLSFFDLRKESGHAAMRRHTESMRRYASR